MNGRGARAGPCGVEYPGNPGELPGYFLGHEISRGTSVTDFPLRSRMTGTISPISRLIFQLCYSPGQSIDLSLKST